MVQRRKGYGFIKPDDGAGRVRSISAVERAGLNTLVTARKVVRGRTTGVRASVSRSAAGVTTASSRQSKAAQARHAGFATADAACYPSAIFAQTIRVCSLDPAPHASSGSYMRAGTALNPRWSAGAGAQKWSDRCRRLHDIPMVGVDMQILLTDQRVLLTTTRRNRRRRRSWCTRSKRRVGQAGCRSPSPCQGIDATRDLRGQQYRQVWRHRGRCVEHVGDVRSVTAVACASDSVCDTIILAVVATPLELDHAEATWSAWRCDGATRPQPLSASRAGHDTQASQGGLSLP